LENVKLQFELLELDSFEVCLAKFFTENCKVLEVMQIDYGNLNFLRHIDWMVKRWRANALEQRKQIGWDHLTSPNVNMEANGNMITFCNAK
jgi:hypothetical protein